MSLKSLTGFDANNQRITGVADGSAGTDAATLQQVQALVRGLNWKAAVRAATTTNGTLATAYANGQSIDGVSLVTGDRILLKNQTTGSENGIYVVAASGAPTRATDADATAEVDGMAVYVTSGTTQHDTAWVETTDVPTIGTTALVFQQFGGGSSVTAGNGLTGTSTLSVLLDTASGLAVSGTGLKIDIAVVVRKFAANCVATTNPQTFNHQLATSDVDVVIQEVSTKKIVQADVTVTDANNVSVDFGGAPTAAQYRVTVHG